ncbi:MAG: response regulator transcription factor [Bdellovibrionales bacterium]|nr:response regulator transcription factor [Bdellovibrionales bacterium]
MLISLKYLHGEYLVSFNNWNKSLVISLTLAAGATVTGFEILTDGEQISVFEFLFDTIEKALIITGAAGVFILLKDSQEQKKERQTLINQLEVARIEGESWRQNAQTFVNGVGQEIEKQFSSWGLSEAEHQVGLLMIKGLSHKEIADLRGTAEATVRQQARNIYQKSGLPGKAAFSAYFLEDLLPPAFAIV